MSVSLNAGVVEFDVNISEFCQVIRDFVGALLDAPAQKALKTMIGEVDKDFELVVDVLMPLYAVNTVSDFRQAWPGLLRDFKTHYFKKWGSLSTQCGIVTDQLQRVQRAHDWKRRIPLLRGAVKRLEDMGQRWMANDAQLYQAMDGFMKSVNQALTAVNQRCRTPTRALEQLRAVLDGAETSLLRIKAYSNEIKRLSAQL